MYYCWVLTSKITEWRFRLCIAIIFVHILTSAISQHTVDWKH